MTYKRMKTILRTLKDLFSFNSATQAEGGRSSAPPIPAILPERVLWEVHPDAKTRINNFDLISIAQAIISEIAPFIPVDKKLDVQIRKPENPYGFCYESGESLLVCKIFDDKTPRDEGLDIINLAFERRHNFARTGNSFGTHTRMLPPIIYQPTDMVARAKDVYARLAASGFQRFPDRKATDFSLTFKINIDEQNDKDTARQTDIQLPVLDHAPHSLAPEDIAERIMFYQNGGAEKLLQSQIAEAYQGHSGKDLRTAIKHIAENIAPYMGKDGLLEFTIKSSYRESHNPINIGVHIQNAEGPYYFAQGPFNSDLPAIPPTGYTDEQIEDVAGEIIGYILDYLHIHGNNPGMFREHPRLIPVTENPSLTIGPMTAINMAPIPDHDADTLSGQYPLSADQAPAP